MAALSKAEYDARLDWTKSKVGDSRPCYVCGMGAILRHPVSGRACHKDCGDQEHARLGR